MRKSEKDKEKEIYAKSIRFIKPKRNLDNVINTTKKLEEETIKMENKL